ncbi:MAG: hypothetical protein R2749_07830 [Acidimicrobiales bacterium]
MLSRYGPVSAPSPPVDASNKWLDAIDERDDDEVQRLTCPSLRDDLDDVAQLLERSDWDGSQDLSGTEIVNASAPVSGTIGTPGGDVSIVLSLAAGVGGSRPSGLVRQRDHRQLTRGGRRPGPTPRLGTLAYGAQRGGGLRLRGD